MPTYVRTDRCDGCAGQPRIECEYICPHDLMLLDRDGSRTGHPMQAYNREPDQCWECYSCVKLCPRDAIEVRHYADVVPLGAQVQPRRAAQSISWTIKFRNGHVKRFTFPTRLTTEGSIDPYAGRPAADLSELGRDDLLFTHATHLGDRNQFLEVAST
jgi:adenylylsulfate reductase, subunit B